MGKEDITLKDYFADAARYADLWNGIMFRGKQIVKAEELEESNPHLPKVDRKGGIATERTRDMIMRQNLNGHRFILLTVENQKYIDYSMPVRIMLQEALAYDRQRKKIAKDNERAERNGESDHYQNNGEFLYKFRKTDRLQPVLTLVAYWGEDEWDGPVSLHGMMDFGDREGNAETGSEEFQSEISEIRNLVPEYSLHFINMSKIEHPEYFKTELRPFLELYRYRNDKAKFIDYIRENENTQQMDDESWNMLAKITHSDKLIEAIQLNDEGEKESHNVCKAIDDFYNDGVEEGKAIGKAEGKAEIVASVRKMYLKNYKVEDIADLLDQERNSIERVLELLISNPEADNLKIAAMLVKEELITSPELSACPVQV